VAGTTARIAADLTGVHVNTVTLFFHKLRERIAAHAPKRSALDGEIEADESYFGGYRKGKRGRGAAGKSLPQRKAGVPVFGLLKRGGRVYTVESPDISCQTLVELIQAHVVPDSIVYTDALKSYDTLDVSSFRHERITKAEGFVKGQGRHINGIEKAIS